MSRVIVAMSGGVDSSVAAVLLKKEGHQVVGASMRIWNGEGPCDEGTYNACYGPDDADIEDARKVADILDIPFHVFDLGNEYRTEVLDYARSEYLSGRTPNPCIRCNRKIKMESLIDKARESGVSFEYVGTGHYARVEWNGGKHRYLLKKAVDEVKDQSYFLSSLSQEQLACSIFPLGMHTKHEVKRIASDLHLGVEDKPESQDFIAGGYLSLFGTESRPGPILDTQGNILGEHKGIHYYTIGQRKGLGISSRTALYVTAIDPKRNTVVVGSEYDIYGDELVCSEMNWIAIDDLKHPAEVKAKIRYNHKEAEARVSPLDRDRTHVKFKEPQIAITPGQAVVFYSGDLVMGSGTIEIEER